MSLMTPPAPPIDDKPERQPSSDTQGDSGTCVRFALAKAIANLLYKNKIDVDQHQIMITLVNIHKNICALSPTKYNDKIVVLQDVENGKEREQKWRYVYSMKQDGSWENKGMKEPEKIPNRSWWEVIHVVTVFGKNDKDSNLDVVEF